jgi:YHS domain-containing protein
MKKDPICGMTVKEKDAFEISYQGQSYHFCSPHCLDKFKKEHGISEQTKADKKKPKKSIFKNKTFIVASLLIALCFISYAIPLLAPFRKSLFDYFKMIWWAILLGQRIL